MRPVTAVIAKVCINIAQLRPKCPFPSFAPDILRMVVRSSVGGRGKIGDEAKIERSRGPRLHIVVHR